MTALERYIRLEAIGIWHEAPEAPPREVVLSFGAATLVLTDLEDRPLGHWALAGIQTIGRRDGATVYAMTPESGETLAIRDPDMVEAIAAVSSAHRHAAPAPPPPRRRLPLGPLLGLAAVAALAALGPGLIRAQAARMLPPGQAVEFGDQMLLGLMESEGGVCSAPPGRRALAALAGRLPGAPARLLVFDLGAPVAALPGGTVLIDRAAVEAAAAPEEVAGWIAVGIGRDPVPALLRAAGPLAGVRYVLTGDLDEAALARAAAAAPAPPGPGEAAAAAARLAAAGLDPAPFARAVERAGQAPPAVVAPAAPTPTLDAPDWAALQAICG